MIAPDSSTISVEPTKFSPLTCVMVKISLVSASLSLASRFGITVSAIPGADSSTLIASPVTIGASFVPLIVTSTICVTAPPSLSVTITS